MTGTNTTLKQNLEPHLGKQIVPLPLHLFIKVNNGFILLFTVSVLFWVQSHVKLTNRAAADKQHIIVVEFKVKTHFVTSKFVFELGFNKESLPFDPWISLSSTLILCLNFAGNPEGLFYVKVVKYGIYKLCTHMEGKDCETWKMSAQIWTPASHRTASQFINDKERTRRQFPYGMIQITIQT